MKTGSKLKKSLNYLLSTLTKDCFLVVIADLEKNLAEVFQFSESVLPLLAKEGVTIETYKDFTTLIGQNYIPMEDRLSFLADFSLPTLSVYLAQHGSYSNKSHIQLNNYAAPVEIRISDISDNQDGSQCVITVRFSEDTLREQPALKKQDDMVKTLFQDYTAVYHVDLDNNTLTILQAKNLIEDNVYPFSDKRIPYEQTIDSFIEDFVRKEDQLKFKMLTRIDYVKDCLTHEIGYSFPYRVKPTKGMEFFELRFLRIDNTVPSSHHAILTLRNVDRITREALRSQRELCEAHEEIEESSNIFADAGFAIWRIILDDGKAPQMLVNKKMFEVCGIDEGQSMSGEEMYDFWWNRVVEEDRKIPEENMANMMAGKFSEATYRWIHPQKGIIYLRCGGRVRLMQKGHILISGYHADATDYVKDELDKKQALATALQAAEQANSEKSGFLAQMSHDIRTPMNAIIGFTSLILQHCDDAEKVKGEAQKVLTSSNHLLGLINDILDMSKIESGKFQINVREFSLAETISLMDSMMRSHFEVKKQTFTIKTSSLTYDSFIADDNRLQQVLINLLSNAHKYTDEGGTITMCVRGQTASSDGYANIEFSISDNGRGMSEEYQKMMFSPFSREKLPQYKETQGTGLGLAITHTLVNMLGGTISVKSKLGVGTTFTVIIPMKIGKNDTKAPPGESPSIIKSPTNEKSVLNGLRILAAEDNELNSEILSEVLKINGAVTTITDDGRKALEAFRESQPGSYSVILMDVQMPVMDGYEATKAIRALSEDNSLSKEKRQEAASIPIIAMTANAFNEDVQKVLLAGMNAHISKPLDIDIVCKTLTWVLTAK